MRDAVNADKKAGVKSPVLHWCKVLLRHTMIPPGSMHERVLANLDISAANWRQLALLHFSLVQQKLGVWGKLQCSCDQQVIVSLIRLQRTLVELQTHGL